MPSIDRHLRDGLIAGILVFALVGFMVYQQYQSLRLAALLGGATGLLVVLGTLFPDTDIKSSKPYRWAVAAGTATGAVTIIVLLVANWKTYLGYLAAWIGGFIPTGVPLPVVGLAAVGITIPALNLFLAKMIDKATGSHRGWTHSPSVLAGIALVSAAVLWLYIPPITLFDVEIRPIIDLGLPAALLLGALIHIGRDKAH
jgi:hypothetical protein